MSCRIGGGLIYCQRVVVTLTTSLSHWLVGIQTLNHLSHKSFSSRFPLNNLHLILTRTGLTIYHFLVSSSHFYFLVTFADDTVRADDTHCCCIVSGPSARCSVQEACVTLVDVCDSFKCGIDYHAPTDCDTIKKWLTKCADDSETANYISAHTKDVSIITAVILSSVVSDIRYDMIEELNTSNYDINPLMPTVAIWVQL